MIEVGDVVEATQFGGQDKFGRPKEVPRPGRVYRVTSIYEMDYGLGCTLHGMDAMPFKGFLLYVAPGAAHGSFRPKEGWYFRKADADKEFVQWMDSIRPSKSKARSARARRS